MHFGTIWCLCERFDASCVCAVKQNVATFLITSDEGQQSKKEIPRFWCTRNDSQRSRSAEDLLSLLSDDAADALLMYSVTSEIFCIYKQAWIVEG